MTLQSNHSHPFRRETTSNQASFVHICFLWEMISSKGGGDGPDLNEEIKRGSERREGGATWAGDVRKELCPDTIFSAPTGIPRMLQQCGNTLHAITPEALYPLSALVSKTDSSDILNLFKGLCCSWKVCGDEKLIISLS